MHHKRVGARFAPALFCWIFYGKDMSKFIECDVENSIVFYLKCKYNDYKIFSLKGVKFYGGGEMG